MPLITANDMFNVRGMYVKVTKQSLFENTVFSNMAFTIFCIYVSCTEILVCIDESFYHTVSLNSTC